jgi:predicted O-methyltransferase YrrM
MNSLQSDERLKAALKRLHAESNAQTRELISFLRSDGARSVSGSDKDLEDGRAFWNDKLVALEPEKAAFCYGLCRAIGARRVIEAGTSFGVSTLYLAAAVRDNGGGMVIATEYEPAKARAARANFSEAGVGELIDLREGDLRETLRAVDGPIDFMLTDIWTPLARPALSLVTPHLRRGAMVIADNTDTYRNAYAAYFAFLADRANGFATVTLPFDGGLEMSVKIG